MRRLVIAIPLMSTFRSIVLGCVSDHSQQEAATSVAPSMSKRPSKYVNVLIWIPYNIYFYIVLYFSMFDTIHYLI